MTGAKSSHGLRLRRMPIGCSDGERVCTGTCGCYMYVSESIDRERRQASVLFHCEAPLCVDMHHHVVSCVYRQPERSSPIAMILLARLCSGIDLSPFCRSVVVYMHPERLSPLWPLLSDGFSLLPGSRSIARLPNLSFSCPTIPTTLSIHI
jgi:hypothetical protein